MSRNTVLLTIGLGFSLGIAPLAASAANPVPLMPWPAEAKAKAAGECKGGMRDRIAQDYLMMTNSTELPTDFYERAAPHLNPLMDACDCAINKLEKQYGYDYYQAHEDIMPPKVSGYVTGACAPKPPVEADAP